MLTSTSSSGVLSFSVALTQKEWRRGMVSMETQPTGMPRWRVMMCTAEIFLVQM
uniref:Uncharacterized protein n=1 Tax=Anguilla anguilla TaxID=7936 RepID=A0A0E9S3G1_ANGAN